MEGARDAGAPVSLLPWAADNRPSAGAFARALATIREEVPPAQLPVSPRMAAASREALAAVRASPLGPLTVFKPLSSGPPSPCDPSQRTGALSCKANLSTY